MIQEKYMKEEGPLFSDKIKDLPKWSPQNEGMLEEVILFFSKFMIDLKRTNDLQKNQIKDLKTELRKTETEFKVFQNKVRHPFRTILKRIFR
jgi:RecA/RadA recombinase